MRLIILGGAMTALACVVAVKTPTLAQIIRIKAEANQIVAQVDNTAADNKAADKGDKKEEPKAHYVDIKAKLPETIDIKKGDSILLIVPFKGDPGLYDPISTPHIKTTDGKKDDVFKTITQVIRIDKDVIRVAQYDSLRTGTAAIEITRFDGKVIATIKVSVK